MGCVTWLLWVLFQRLMFELYGRVLPRWPALVMTVITALVSGAVVYRVVERAKAKPSA